MLANLRVAAKTSTTADLATRWMSSLWVAVVVGCVYMLSAKMSLALLTPDGVAVFWPAAGVAAGTLIAIGPHVRWPVVVGVAIVLIAALGTYFEWFRSRTLPQPRRLDRIPQTQ